MNYSLLGISSISFSKKDLCSDFFYGNIGEKLDTMTYGFINPLLNSKFLSRVPLKERSINVMGVDSILTIKEGKGNSNQECEEGEGHGVQNDGSVLKKEISNQFVF